MGRRKLEKMEKIATMPHVFWVGKDETPQPGQWQMYFGNQHPIILELGCGHGDYTIEMAQLNPNNNYIGVDLKGPRMWSGIRRSFERKMRNVAFIRSDIRDISQFFGQREIEEIWITFPDPHPKPCRWKKRLTSAWFLSLYQNILKSDGLIHVKTDNEELYAFTLWTIEHFGLELRRRIDVVAEHISDSFLSIQTFYEKAHRLEGRTIHYVVFSLGSKMLDQEAIKKVKFPL